LTRGVRPEKANARLEKQRLVIAREMLKESRAFLLASVG
jgi:hypothetical protein